MKKRDKGNESMRHQLNDTNCEAGKYLTTNKILLEKNKNFIIVHYKRLAMQNRLQTWDRHILNVAELNMFAALNPLPNLGQRCYRTT